MDAEVSKDTVSSQAVDSLLKLFHSIPNIKISSTIKNHRDILKKHGHLLYDNNSWKVLYGEDLLDDPENYEDAKVDISHKLISYVFSMDERQVLFFKVDTIQMAIVNVSLNVTSGMPQDHLFVFEIDRQLYWREVTKEVLDRGKIVKCFIPKESSPETFEDIFDIQVDSMATIVIRPQWMYQKFLDNAYYPNHPFFRIDKSKMEDSIVCVLNKDKRKFEIQYPDSTKGTSK